MNTSWLIFSVASETGGYNKSGKNMFMLQVPSKLKNRKKLGGTWEVKGPPDCAKSVRIRSYFGPHFSAFGLNMERYGVSLHMQSKCGKMQTRITSNTDNLHAVSATVFLILSRFTLKASFKLICFSKIIPPLSV